MIEEIIRKNEKRIEKDISKFKDIKNIDFIDIFPISEKHKKQLDLEVANIAKIIDKTEKGTFYLLNQPILTKWGKLSFLKIRYFDATKLNWEAAPDFEIEDWNSLKQQVEKDETLTFISREKWDAIEYKSKDSLIYFLNPLVTSVYRIRK